MSYKVIHAISFLVGFMLLFGESSAAALPSDDLDDFSDESDGNYVFSFSLPDQERVENRDAFGKVTGSFSFVDKAGQAVSVQFDADENGYRPLSDALPQAPLDTNDVALARQQFLRYYENRAKFLEEVNSDESNSYEDSFESDEDDSSSEEDDD
ncbi:larval cuticle protein 1-like isoform X2 [Panulirus ornatus]|uniref:larval cuticle protein 1-like isoform X2 n=1 Tax=Panulirus ornatus TaxID=150431 RepID=UPI003A8B9C06